MIRLRWLIVKKVLDFSFE